MKILIQNGRLVDPASSLDQVGDLAITSGRISAIGKVNADFAPDRVIDASAGFTNADREYLLHRGIGITGLVERANHVAEFIDLAMCRPGRRVGRLELAVGLLVAGPLGVLEQVHARDEVLAGLLGVGGGIVIGGGGPGGVVVGGSQQEAAFPKTEVRDFTGNVSPFGKQTKVRVSFQRERRDDVLALLNRVDLAPDNPDALLADGFVYGMVIQHEHQHDETLVATLQLMGERALAPPGTSPAPRTSLVDPASLPAMQTIDSGVSTLGTDAYPWTYDNERAAHRVEIAERGVVVVGPVCLAPVAHHDPTGATIHGSWGRDRVLVVIAGVRLGQDPSRFSNTAPSCPNG